MPNSVIEYAEQNRHDCKVEIDLLSTNIAYHKNTKLTTTTDERIG